VFHPMLGTHREMLFVQEGEVASRKWKPINSRKKSFSLAAGGGGLLPGTSSEAFTAAAASMDAKVTGRKFFGAGSFFGETLMLLPDEVPFQLQVTSFPHKCILLSSYV
jgi:hypothetical protein